MIARLSEFSPDRSGYKKGRPGGGFGIKMRTTTKAVKDGKAYGTWGTEAPREAAVFSCRRVRNDGIFGGRQMRRKKEEEAVTVSVLLL